MIEYCARELATIEMHTKDCSHRWIDMLQLPARLLGMVECFSDNLQQKAFVEFKKLLTSDHLLIHIDPTKKLFLACDASPYGVGAVLLHHGPNGEKKPIVFASHSLGTAEECSG